MGNKKINQKIGRKIRNIRNLKGMSQQEVADALGLNFKTTISSIEKGTRPIKVDELIKLAEIFDISPAYLLDIKTPDYTEVPNLVNSYFKDLKKLTDEFSSNLLKILNPKEDLGKNRD